MQSIFWILFLYSCISLLLQASRRPPNSLTSVIGFLELSRSQFSLETGVTAFSLDEAREEAREVATFLLISSTLARAYSDAAKSLSPMFMIILIIKILNVNLYSVPLPEDNIIILSGLRKMEKVNNMTTQLSTNIRKRMLFSRKLALTFFIITLVTFVIIDVIMNVIYEKIITETDFVGTANINDFNQFSNQEVLSSTNAYLYSGLNMFDEIIQEIYGAYLYFQDNPSIYISREQPGVNPAFTSTFSSPRYDRSSVFFLNDQATFFNQPYLDQCLSSAISSVFPPNIKRINIFYQDPLNPEDLMARTVPATDQFNIPNSSVISKRMETSIEGETILTNWYVDELSASNSSSEELIALRFLMPNGTEGGFNMLIEVEMQRQVLQNALENVYSFPSTNILLLMILNNETANTTEYSILGQSYPIDSSIQLENYLTPGNYPISIEGEDFLLSTSLPANDSPLPQSAARRMLSSTRGVIDSSVVSMIILNVTETAQPNTVYFSYLRNEKRILVYMLYGWTFIVLVFTCSIGLVIGHYLFSYFNLILKKCKLYISSPEKIKEIHYEMKKLSSNEKRNRLLMENLIQIMQKIENKKNENRKKLVKETDEFPLNLLNADFQNRMKLKDMMRFESIAEQLAYNIANPL